MTTTVTGTVQKVTKGKSFNTQFGDMVSYDISVETDTGAIVVQRNGMATGNFSLPTGTKVQATYTEKTINSTKGTFVKNQLMKDGLLVLTETGEALQVSGSGTPKQPFNPTPNRTQQPTTTSKPTTYNNEGARNGMIVNASLALATARKDVSLQALLKAVDDIKTVTQYVEENKAPKTAPQASTTPKTASKTGVQTLDDEDEDSPFDFD